MALSVNTNLSALQAYNNLSRTSASMASSMAKLSSGLRINTRGRRRRRPDDLRGPAGRRSAATASPLATRRTAST